MSLFLAVALLGAIAPSRAEVAMISTTNDSVILSTPPGGRLLVNDVDLVAEMNNIELQIEAVEVENAKLSALGDAMLVAMSTLAAQLSSPSCSTTPAPTATSFIAVPPLSCLGLGSDFIGFDNVAGAKLTPSSNCTAIHGHLIAEDLNSLSFLSWSFLSVIANDFVVQGCIGVTVLSLPRLQFAASNLVVVLNPALGAVDLSGLEIVQDNLHVASNAQLSSLSLSVLRSAYSIYVDSNPLLATLVFPRLSVVGFDCQVVSNTALTFLDLSQLSIVGATLYIAFNPLLAMLETGALQFVLRSVDIETNAVLTSISLPQMNSALLFTISSNEGLPFLDLPLQYASSELSVTYNSRLTFLSFPRMTYAYIFGVYGNNQLTLISIPSLRSVGFVNAICQNGPTFVIPSVFAAYPALCAQGNGPCPANEVLCK